jgi:chromosomal replication initiation ATPase DnaA
VHEWLMRRLPRSGAAVREAVALIDAASLAQRRRITVPLAVEVLGNMLAQKEISGESPPPSRRDPAVL